MSIRDKLAAQCRRGQWTGGYPVLGDRVRFRGPFCVSEGELVTLTGQWKSDPKYGPQFDAKSVSYDLPETPEGLVQYLAKHPAFTGIGETTARKIVSYVASAEHLDRVIRQDIEELHRALRIPKRTLNSLREAWIANSDENEVRTYLAGFGLSHHQMETLLEEFGSSVVGVLRANPYLIIRYIKGYGFKRVDKIARSMGVPKEHPGRLEAALCYLVREEASDGHTWIAHDELIRKAIDLLLLDSLDSRSIIEAAFQRAVEQEELIVDGDAVALARYVEAERLIYQCFELYGHDVDPIGIEPAHGTGLKRAQFAAYEAAMRHAIVVISGGAGTGKTHTLARVAQTFKEANLRIALCSPTGKAAKRIEESLRALGLDLEAKTIHRLLAYNGREFQRESLSPPDDEETPGVPSGDGFDVIIIDEFSMVDVPLMAELLRRIDLDKTRLILVGDHNQLPPVGAGNVLRDCIKHKLVPTFILDEVVRQAGVLKTNSMAVLSQRVMPTAVGDPAWSVIDSLKEPTQIQVYLRDLVLNRIPDRLGLDPVNDVQITAHDKDTDKEFWTRCVLVISKDLNLTKGHVRYLESRIIEKGHASGRARLSNGTAPPLPPMPEPDVADMEGFLLHVELVLPVLGFDFLKPRPVVRPAGAVEVTASSPIFEYRVGEASAKAQEIDGEFVVLKGSTALATPKDSWTSYRGLRDRLVEDQKLVAVPDRDLYQFAEDVPFKSPSAGGAVVYAGSINGRTVWKVAGTNQTYADWHQSQLPEQDPMDGQ